MREEQAGMICEPGERIANRYEIVKRLGKGGMGDVYLAADLRLGRKLRAVKLLRRADGMAEHADAELGMLLRVNHPRLPQIVDYVPPDAERPAALVTDYAEGENLADWFERRGRRVSAEAAVAIGRQLCEALAYLHELAPPIVHRDLKPANVMIDGDGFVRLIDLGIARLVKHGSRQDTLHLGTPGFAAPEQGDPNGHSDGRTDLYGLGALLYYLLSGGKTPVCGAPDQALLDSSMPATLRAAIASLLQADPDQRPADARSAERLLAGAHASDAPGTPPVRVIAVASYAPGSGATFVAVTLSRLLADSGIPCTLVEHPLVEPRLFAMLTNGGTTAGHARADGAMQPIDKRYIGIRSGTLDVQALHPDRPIQAGELDGARLTRDGEGRVAIVDLSSAWPDASAAELLAGCELLLVVADPDIARWTPQRRAAWRRLAAERERQGRDSVWLANQDARFAGRKEWLRLMPQRPLASIPLLPVPEWRAMQYANRWATEHPAWRRLLEEALMPIIDRF